jgi:hypothetical protein
LHRGYDNALEKRRTELRRMARTKIEAIEQKAITEIELSCLEAQTQLAVAGLSSESARVFVERLPGIEALMPRLSFSEVAGEAEPPIAEQLLSDRPAAWAPPQAREAVPPPSLDACLVCGGAQIWKGEPCWCCVRRLTGPKRAIEAPPGDDYPDLQKWVEHYGGYAKIDWAAWDAAVKRADEAPASIASLVCVHCGGTDDEYGNRLLQVVPIGVRKRAFIHARCWPLYKRDADADPKGEESSGERQAALRNAEASRARLPDAMSAAGKRRCAPPRKRSLSGSPSRSPT